jgi:hypothetical protein
MPLAIKEDHMSEAERKAPSGKFIVGEAFYAEDDWAPVGQPHDSLAVAREMARELNAPRRPDLHYFVYDENGLVAEEDPGSTGAT